MPRPIYGARRKAAKPKKHYEKPKTIPKAIIRTKIQNVIENNKDSIKYFFILL